MSTDSSDAVIISMLEGLGKQIDGMGSDIDSLSDDVKNLRDRLSDKVSELTERIVHLEARTDSEEIAELRKTLQEAFNRIRVLEDAATKRAGALTLGKWLSNGLARYMPWMFATLAAAWAAFERLRDGGS